MTSIVPRRARAVAGAAALALLLAACGQKGPLYLPAPQPQAVPPAATPPATTPPAATPPADTAPQPRKLPAKPDPAAAQ
jgi:DedD protein